MQGALSGSAPATILHLPRADGHPARAYMFERLLERFTRHAACIDEEKLFVRLHRPHTGEEGVEVQCAIETMIWLRSIISQQQDGLGSRYTMTAEKEHGQVVAIP